MVCHHQRSRNQQSGRTDIDREDGRRPLDNPLLVHRPPADPALGVPSAEQAATDLTEANDRASANHRNMTMREFFRGRRRKIGVLTLVTACVFAAAWMRSQGHNDELNFWTGPHEIHSLNSSPTGMCWMKWSNLAPSFPMTTGRFGWVAFQSWPRDVCNPFRWSTPQWQFASMGFHFAQSTIDPPDRGNLAVWMIPYWPIVIPLTLLSAWLLLIKPRPPAWKTTADLSPKGGA